MGCPFSHLRRLAAVNSFVAILVATAFAATDSSAAAGGLFEPATAVEMMAAPLRAGSMRETLRGAGNRGLRERLVTLNTSELDRIVPANADNAANRLERARARTGAVAVDLFPGVSVTAQRTDVQTPDDGGYVWVGRAGGPRPAWMTLVINNNEILGQVQTGGRLYSIEPVSGNLHRIVEINQDKIRDDIHFDAPAELLETKGEAPRSSTKQSYAPSSIAESSTTITTINVMVAHTVNARKEVGSATQMRARINMAIALANQAFSNNGATVRFVRVGGENEINYDESKPYGGLNTWSNYVGSLCDLTGVNCSSLGVSNNRTDQFSTLRSKRSHVDADLVVLMRKQGAACGVAWVVEKPATSDANRGFSVMTSSPNYSCVEGNTLAHETGHNMGLHHDRIAHKNETGDTPSASKFNFGHVDKIGKFFDIMAYRSSCGTGCTRAPYFSTPLRNYPDASGRPLGIAQYSAGAADATRALKGSTTSIASYR